MICPHCNEKTRVLETGNHRINGTKIKFNSRLERRRGCDSCGLRFKTVEIVSPRDAVMVYGRTLKSYMSILQGLGESAQRALREI